MPRDPDMTGLEQDPEFDFDFLFEFDQSGGGAAAAGGSGGGRRAPAPRRGPEFAEVAGARPNLAPAGTPGRRPVRPGASQTKLLPAARRREATCGASLPRSPAGALPGIGAPGPGRGLTPPSRRPLPAGRLCPAQDLDLVVRGQMVSGAARGRSEAALSESPAATAGPRGPGARRPGPVLTATAAPSAGRLYHLGF